VDSAPTGIGLKLCTCDVCSLTFSYRTEVEERTGSTTQCRRCRSEVHLPRPHGLTATAAYLLAAAILYVPANLLPVMHTSTLVGSNDDTIISGVLLLISLGSWPLALLVFVASIVVPVLKLLAIGMLVITVKRRSGWRPLQRTQLYRVVEFVGRWSMLDVYVITVLVSLVQFQSLASIAPGAGALAFGAVVVLTMLAAQNFDPRLIWEADAVAHD
jgi:paraquat-inducible protein A